MAERSRVERAGELFVDREAGIVAVAGERSELREVPSELEALREQVRFDAQGRYRPLTGARTLPAGWFVRVERALVPRGATSVAPVRGPAGPKERASVAAVRSFLESQTAPIGPVAAGRSTHDPEEQRLLTADEVIETVYPLATVHRQQHADGTLRLVSLGEVIARQQGRYRSAAQLDPEGRELATRMVCGICVRTPVWNGERVPEDGIPCPEPCSVLLSFVREAAEWQANPPVPATPDPKVAFAAFDEPGNELREEYLRLRAEAAR